MSRLSLNGALAPWANGVLVGVQARWIEQVHLLQSTSFRFEGEFFFAAVVKLVTEEYS